MDSMNMNMTTNENDAPARALAGLLKEIEDTAGEPVYGTLTDLQSLQLRRLLTLHGVSAMTQAVLESAHDGGMADFDLYHGTGLALLGAMGFIGRTRAERLATAAYETLEGTEAAIALWMVEQSATRRWDDVIKQTDGAGYPQRPLNVSDPGLRRALSNIFPGMKPGVLLLTLADAVSIHADLNSGLLSVWMALLARLTPPWRWHMLELSVAAMNAYESDAAKIDEEWRQLMARR